MPGEMDEKRVSALSENSSYFQYIVAAGRALAEARALQLVGSDEKEVLLSTEAKLKRLLNCCALR